MFTTGYQFGPLQTIYKTHLSASLRNTLYMTSLWLTDTFSIMWPIKKNSFLSPILGIFKNAPTVLKAVSINYVGISQNLQKWMTCKKCCQKSLLRNLVWGQYLTRDTQRYCYMWKFLLLPLTIFSSKSNFCLMVFGNWWTNLCSEKCNLDIIPAWQQLRSAFCHVTFFWKLFWRILKD